jgi:hypothetical protein
VPEVRRLLAIALPLPAHSNAVRWAWSCWRRAKRRMARDSHYRRREQRAQAHIEAPDTS